MVNTDVFVVCLYCLVGSVGMTGWEKVRRGSYSSRIAGTDFVDAPSNLRV